MRSGKAGMVRRAAPEEAISLQRAFPCGVPVMTVGQTVSRGGLNKVRDQVSE